MGFVRSIIPSRSTNADGTLSSKAEAFGRVSMQGMERVCQRKITACKKLHAPKRQAGPASASAFEALKL
jgi:hypothetical protein